MVDYITIGIKTLLGKSNIIPSYLRLLSPTRYVYIRKELDNIILDNNYYKIEYGSSVSVDVLLELELEPPSQALSKSIEKIIAAAIKEDFKEFISGKELMIFIGRPFGSGR